MKHLRICALALVFALPGFAAVAQSPAKFTMLMDALGLAEMMQIVRDEGLGYADDLNADMLEGQGAGFWLGQVDRIYDTERMNETVRLGLERTLNDEAVDASLAFFQSKTGTEIIGLENAARAAMTDTEVEEIARQTYREMAQAGDSDRLALISRFIEVNDLVDRNVTGALTSNYQFYQGLNDGAAFDLSEEEMIAEVWLQEEDIREDTIEWLFGYLIMAYQPLSEQDLEAYVVFSQTEAGQALNAGLFSGFDDMYVDISYALGRAVAMELAASEL